MKKLEPNYKLIKQLVRESRMPMCYGGGIKKLDQVKLRHFCSSNLSDFQQPFHFFFRTKLPKNTLGKIKKNLLIEEYNKKDY